MSESLSHEELVLEQTKLRGDLETVRAYGEDHPDEWTDVLFENEPTVRIVVLIASPVPERHERSLRELVSHPDQIKVRHSKFARRYLEEIVGAVRAQWRKSDPGTFLSMGVSRGQVKILLRADQEARAAALIGQYGDAVDVSVGAFHFPMAADQDQDVDPRVGDFPSTIEPISIRDLSVALVGNLRVVSGSTVQSALEVTNIGSEEIVLDTNGGIVARILEPRTGLVVGGFVGVQTAQLIRYSLPPKLTVRVPLVVGTASFRQELGYAVPPGNWMLDTIVTLQGVGERRTAPLPIVILALNEIQGRDDIRHD